MKDKSLSVVWVYASNSIVCLLYAKKLYIFLLFQPDGIFQMQFPLIAIS